MSGETQMAMAKLKAGGQRLSAPSWMSAERASRDEIMALQTRRLAWSLKHAYDNVAHYQEGLRRRRRASLRFQASFPISPNSRSR